MRRVARTAVAAVLAALVLPGTALADCLGKEQMNQLFQGFDGDSNSYFVAPGGSFEGTQTVTTTGATKLVSPGHSVGAVGTKTGLLLGDGATVTTEEFCVDNLRQHVRFLIKRTSSTGSLTVEAIDAAGTATLLDTVTSAPSRGWGATQFVPLAPRLALPVGLDTTVRMRVTATGTWVVDGLAVDPYRY